MKTKYLCMAALALGLSASAARTPDRQAWSVYVDKQGVMRRSDTGREVSYYGTNYTAPFAHAYRALGYLGVDRKEAIKRDVYHMARLGLNAFRLHLWDVELSDAQGNLQANDHLDLLDFLIAELEKRGIDIVLTAQTDFGNGYPEKNVDTGAFAYDYDKCEIHENPQAQKAQENYLRQLAGHVNPYTGLSYGKDRAIIAMEINNEPCHSGTPAQVTAYINRMAKALKKGGFDKPILYNVSHNPDVTEAYYKADIQGTTFQWYPTGLVAGHERKGNFLPYVDEYVIPWKDSMPGYGDKARLVYEFDPGDVLVTYLYPAIARTFRKEGFQWITQFAYDPTDMARFNTEYQTHFLNLAYTPGKAIGMLIASQVAQDTPRGADFGSYPQNADFGHVSLSADKDVALYNSPTRYYYTNDTDVRPADPARLEHIAGVGSSPLVTYGGTGAYFLDRLDSHHWRLEVMPDVLLTEDPFRKPSLSREVGVIEYNDRPLTLHAGSPLPSDFTLTPVAGPSPARAAVAVGGRVSVRPGVYILSDGAPELDKWPADIMVGNMRMDEFVAPGPSSYSGVRLRHTQPFGATQCDTITLTADVADGEAIDSLVIYPGDISFWRDDNKLYPMTPGAGPYRYEGELPLQGLGKQGRYWLVAWRDGKPYTFPSGRPGTPLDWDFPEDAPAYTVTQADFDDPAVLMGAGMSGRVDSGSIPDGQGAWFSETPADYSSPATLDMSFTPTRDNVRAVMRSYIGDLDPDWFDGAGELDIVFEWEPVGVETIEAGLVDSDGVSYTATVPVDSLTHAPDGTYIAKVPVDSLRPSQTWLLPAAYPSFMARSYDGTSRGSATGTLGHPEYAVISLPGLQKDTPVKLRLRAMLLYKDF